MKAMEEVMTSLRADPPAEVAGLAVTGRTDYLRDNTGLIPSDVLELHPAGGAKLIVRPSGTEPKLKLYLSVKGGSEEEAGRLLNALTAGANALVNKRSRS